MNSLFADYKQQIVSYLNVFLNERKTQFGEVNEWGPDVLERLSKFSQSGKMIRGSLVFFGFDIFAKTHNEEVVKVAGALELAHSAILIHDDIIDKDTLRRTQPTIHAQYEHVARSQRLPNPQQFGMAAGICVGDIGFYLGFELLSTLNAQTAIKQQILTTYAQELQAVGLAELGDVYFGSSAQSPSEEAILALYTYKTGRYTFSLPLMLGALLAGESAQNQKLAEIGQDLGVMFQLRDDYLGIFGTTETGKGVGGDISENKKTLYRHHLFTKSSPDEKKVLTEIFGKQSITTDELHWVRNLISALGIDTVIDQKIEQLGLHVSSAIESLPISTSHKKIFRDLVTFNQTRTA
jgi:geranylgeranyl diphosphate synthase type I